MSLVWGIRKRGGDGSGWSWHHIKVTGKTDQTGRRRWDRTLTMPFGKMRAFEFGLDLRRDLPSGKTYLAMAMAMQRSSKEVSRIILTRPAIRIANGKENYAEFLREILRQDRSYRPLYDALYQIMGADESLQKEVLEMLTDLIELHLLLSSVEGRTNWDGEQCVYHSYGYGLPRGATEYENRHRSDENVLWESFQSQKSPDATQGPSIGGAGFGHPVFECDQVMQKSGDVGNICTDDRIFRCGTLYRRYHVLAIWSMLWKSKQLYPRTRAVKENLQIPENLGCI